eukprot:1448884-Prymnesium_polylepis.1
MPQSRQIVGWFWPRTIRLTSIDRQVLAVCKVARLQTETQKTLGDRTRERDTFHRRVQRAVWQLAHTSRAHTNRRKL